MASIETALLRTWLMILVATLSPVIGDNKETNYEVVAPLSMGKGLNSSLAYATHALAAEEGTYSECGAICLGDPFCFSFNIRVVVGESTQCEFFSIVHQSTDRLQQRPQTGYMIKDSIVGLAVTDMSEYIWSALNIMLSPSFKKAGKVKAWIINAKYAKVMFAGVWRPLDGNEYELIGKNRLTIPSPGKQIFEINDEEQIAVKRGDLIGIHSADGTGRNVYTSLVPTAGFNKQDLPTCVTHHTFKDPDLPSGVILKLPASDGNKKLLAIAALL